MGFIEHTSNPKEPICKGFLNLKPEKRGGGPKKLQKNQKNKNCIMTMCGQQILLKPVGFSDETATWLDSEKRRDIQTSGIASDVNVWKGVIHRSDDPR